VYVWKGSGDSLVCINTFFLLDYGGHQVTIVGGFEESKWLKTSRPRMESMKSVIGWNCVCPIRRNFLEFLSANSFSIAHPVL
jgi:hypothetical protein